MSERELLWAGTWADWQRYYADQTDDEETNADGCIACEPCECPPLGEWRHGV